MWRNSDFKIYFSVLKIYFKAMVPPYMLVRKPRRKVLGCFSCVVSPVEALLCGSVPRRRVSGCFSCVVSCVVLCRTVSQTRRRVSGCFSCVVSCVVLCRTVSQTRRKVSGCFSCVVYYLMSSSVVKGWVKPEMRCRIRSA